MASGRAAAQSVRSAGQVGGVWLHRFTLPQKQYSFLPSGHRANKRLGLIEYLAEAPRDVTSVHRLGQSQIAMVIGAIARVAADLAYQTFWCVPGRLGDGGPNNCAKWQMAFVDMEQIKYIARFASTAAANALLVAISATCSR
jgi:hypothetical protein